MDVDELAERYPRLFHMAEPDSWPSIQRHGLLSTTALLDLFAIAGKERLSIESNLRPNSVVIEHAKHGKATIRDQKPMSLGGLNKCLSGLTPTAWCKTLNARVFFWLSEERLLKLLQARAYRDQAHCVITVATKDILARHLQDVTLSPINSGSTIFRPAPRGADTFQAVPRYDYESWRKKRGRANAIVELAVRYAVPDIAEFAITAKLHNGPVATKTLFRRKKD